MLLPVRAQPVHNGASGQSARAPCVLVAGVHRKQSVRGPQRVHAVLEDELARAQQDQKLAYDGPGKEYGPVGPKGAKVEKVCPLVVSRVYSPICHAHTPMGEGLTAYTSVRTLGVISSACSPLARGVCHVAAQVSVFGSRP
jgi:hypothetical protein